MIDFFVETLSGMTYIIAVIIGIILILALIGVMSEVKYMKTIDDTPSSKKSEIDNKNVEEQTVATTSTSVVNTNETPSTNVVNNDATSVEVPKAPINTNNNVI